MNFLSNSNTNLPEAMSTTAEEGQNNTLDDIANMFDGELLHVCDPSFAVTSTNNDMWISVATSSEPVLLPTFDTKFCNQPFLQSYDGDYGFTHSFEDQPKISKNINWTFSQNLKKLYTSINSFCPIRFSVRQQLPESSWLCVIAVYKDDCSRLDNVKTCPNHDRRTGAGVQKDQHWVECNDERTQYGIDVANNNRSYMLIPFDQPNFGGYSLYRFRFVCRNSCPGGPNRRPTELVVSLFVQGVEVGRCVLDVKVCACPGRDRRHDEDTLAEQLSRVNKAVNRKRPHESSGRSHSSSDRDDDQIYTLTVRGYKTYECLKKMVDALEFKRKVNLSRRKKIRIKQESPEEDSSESEINISLTPNTT